MATTTPRKRTSLKKKTAAAADAAPARKPHGSPAVQVFRSLADVPLICTIDEVCAIYRRAKSTVLRDLRTNVFTPQPFAERPYYWHKADIERDLQLKSAAAHERVRHQFAEHRDRP